MSRRALAALSLALLAASAAGAQPVVYHSPDPDGANPGREALLAANQAAELLLFVVAGENASHPGLACRAGTGDEICFFEVHVEARGDALLAAFEPADGVLFSLAGGVLRANGGDPEAGRLSPSPIGRLEVSVGDGGSVELVGGAVLDARLALRPVAPRALARTAEDADSDGLPDPLDNCPLRPNAELLGTCVAGDALLVGAPCAEDAACGPPGRCSRAQQDADADGTGDACECGDANGDGLLTSDDARSISRCATGQIPCSPLCDTNGDALCDGEDARRIQGVAVGRFAEAELTCAARP